MGVGGGLGDACGGDGDGGPPSRAKVCRGVRATSSVHAAASQQACTYLIPWVSSLTRAAAGVSLLPMSPADLVSIVR
eukprot:3888353-Pyramimonas_sp.AAC.1